MARKKKTFVLRYKIQTRVTSPIHSIPLTYAASPIIIQQEALEGLGLTPGALLAHSPTPIPMANGVQAQALHINGLSPDTN